MRVTGNPNVTHFTTLEFHGLPSDKPVLSPTNALRFPLPVVMLPEEGTGFHTKSLSIAYLLNEEARGAGLGHFKTVSGWSPSYDRLQAKPLPDLVVSVDSWHPDETQRHKERNHYNRLRSTLMLMDPPRTKTVLPIWFSAYGMVITGVSQHAYFPHRSTWPSDWVALYLHNDWERSSAKTHVSDPADPYT